MKAEELFLAIGEVEASRLARSELTVRKPSGQRDQEEPNMKKKNVSRLLRNLLVAALIVSMLAVTAYAVAGYVIFDSPQEMLTSLFGDQTGYDHNQGSVTPLPDGVNTIIEPTFDRVPADETVIQEEIAPHVNPVGQTIHYEDFTLTVDSYLYDNTTRCGFVTYLLENPNGVSGYTLQSDGEFYFGSGELYDINQYGYPYIIQEKTTDTCLAATYYFRYNKPHADNFLRISFPGGREPLSDEEINSIMRELYAQVRQEFTPEEAKAKVKDFLGEAQYAESTGGTPKGYTREQWEEECAYSIIASQRYHAQYDDVGEAITIPLEGEPLSHVTAGKQSVIVTPISIQIDVTDLDFLHTDREGNPYISADNVDSVAIRYQDGSEYLIHGDYVENQVFGIISSASEGKSDTDHLLTFMFNRIIDVEKVAAVIINGMELPIE